MKAQDITEFKETPSHQHMNVFIAFMQGHIIQVAGEDYRYANKDEVMYSEGDMEYAAMESGIFKRFLSFTDKVEEYTKETASSFKWMFIADSASYIFSIINEMTEEEVIMALGNKVLTETNRKNRG